MRACIPSSPPRLRANAISTMKASRVSANLQQQDPCHFSHDLSLGLSPKPTQLMVNAVFMMVADKVSAQVAVYPITKSAILKI